MGTTVTPSQIWPEIIHPYSPVLKPLSRPVSGPFDEPCACLFVNAEWRGYLIGALEVLAQRDAWNGTEEQIDTAIEGVEEIIACLIGGEMSCLSEMTDRLDALRVCCASQTQAAQIQNILYAEHIAERYDGNPWSVDEDVPHDNWTETTGDSADKIAEREVALCRAINRYIETINNQLRLNRMAATGLAEISAGIAAFINPILGIVIGAIEGALIGIPEAVWNDSAAIKKVACCMYTNLLAETSIDHAGFKTSAQDCSFSGLSNEELIRVAIDGFNQDEGNYLAFLDALGEETRLAAIYPGDTYDCACSYDWEQVLDLTVSDDFCSPKVNIYDGDPYLAEYIAGEGFGPQDMSSGGANYQRIMHIDINPLSSGVIERMEITYHCDPGTYDLGGESNSEQTFIFNGTTLQDSDVNPIQDGSNKTRVWTGSETFTEAQVYLRTSARVSTAEWTGDCRLVRVVLSGSGDNPFE